MIPQAAGGSRANGRATPMGPITRPASDISRRRRTITVAGTIFGAAIALTPLYSHCVFDAECQSFTRCYFPNSRDFTLPRTEPLVSAGEECQIQISGRPVRQGEVPIGTGQSLVDSWCLRVIGTLVLFGGFLGGLVGSHRFWSSGPPPRLRPWHWIVGPAVMLVALFLTGLPRSKEPSLFVRLTDPLLTIPRGNGPMPICEALPKAGGLALLSVVIGWAGTVVAVAWGKLLPPRPPPDQAADYDDRAHPSRPTAG
jgi:hypothetical protein